MLPVRARRSHLRRSPSDAERLLDEAGQRRRRWSAARRPLRRRRPWLWRRERPRAWAEPLGTWELAEGAAALAPTAGEVAGTLAGAAGAAAMSGQNGGILQWPTGDKTVYAIKRSTGDKTVCGLPCPVADKLLARDNVEFATRSSNLDVWPFGCFCLDKTDRPL